MKCPPASSSRRDDATAIINAGDIWVWFPPPHARPQVYFALIYFKSTCCNRTIALAQDTVGYTASYRQKYMLQWNHWHNAQWAIRRHIANNSLPQMEYWFRYYETKKIRHIIREESGVYLYGSEIIKVWSCMFVLEYDHVHLIVVSITTSFSKCVGVVSIHIIVIIFQSGTLWLWNHNLSSCFSRNTS